MDGATSQAVDSTGALVETTKYDVHGTPTTTVAAGKTATGNRFLFTGREYFSTIGLYNYRNRFYAPAWGRFLQPDPIGFAGDSANLYRYGANNPANASDPDGTTVYMNQHPVVWPFPFYHTWTSIVPSNPSTFVGSSRLQNGQVTISGFPTGNFFYSGLTQTFNRNNKTVPTYRQEVPPPPDMTKGQFDNATFNAGASFLAGAYHYSFLPGVFNFISKLFGGLFGHVYNSNGVTAGTLINGGRADGTSIVQSLPGSQPGSNNPPPWTALNSVLARASYRDTNGLIYDANGKVIADAGSLFTTDSANVSGIAPAGVMSVPWPTAQMPSGIQQ